MNLHELTIKKAHMLLKEKEISSQELTRAVLDRIDDVEEKVGAYIAVAGERAMAQAEIADKEISQGNIL
ncbi:MAG: Asp-tRNA(Asn)/Glu-tRNA(Gln) amidotransferase subunit GatA, partial [Deltaproteobacteria bacterium]|nr:Asp-tRNA(Asn)/Glu-tRNA(Gln) amidotransferase subunit GatA [Deltaproteobacteria bacterium]